MRTEYRLNNRKKIKNIKINMKDWLLTIFSAVFFLPANYAVPGSIYTLWQLAIVAVSMFYLLKYFFRNRISLLWVISFLFFAYYFVVSSIIKSRTIIIVAVFSFIRCIGFVTMVEFETCYHFERFVKRFIIGGVFMCAIHFVTFLRYRNIVGGMNPVRTYEGKISAQHWYFFTHSNGSIFYILPVIGIIWFSCFEINKKYKPAAYIFTVLMIVMYALEGSVTALMATVIILLYVMLYRMKFVQKLTDKFLDHKTTNIIGITFCILMIIMNIAGQFSGVFSYLGKTNEDARATFWINSLKYFSANPLLGVGYENDLIIVAHIGKNHCHNILIQILYTTGLTGLVLFIAMLVLSAPLKSVKKSGGTAVLYVTLLAFWVASAYDWYLYMPYSFAILYMLKNYRDRGYQIVKLKHIDRRLKLCFR